MKTRIISGAVAVAIAIVLLILHNTFMFNLAIAFLSIVAIFEIFRALKIDEKKEYKFLAYACYGYAFLDAFMDVFYRNGWLVWLNSRFYFGLFIIAMMLLYLKFHEQVKHTEVLSMIAATTLITYSFGTLLLMSSSSVSPVFMIVLTLCGAWLADTGAYFAGTFFGKTPLCPNISPKKTVEGLIGGVISNGVLFLIIGLFYGVIFDKASLDFVMLFVAGMGCALVGLLGDLTASMLKRQCGIKDYGKIMPGHGGIMDRFDSVLFVAPFMYYLFSQGLIVKDLGLISNFLSNFNI